MHNHILLADLHTYDSSEVETFGAATEETVRKLGQEFNNLLSILGDTKANNPVNHDKQSRHPTRLFVRNLHVTRQSRRPAVDIFRLELLQVALIGDAVALRLEDRARPAAARVHGLLK